MKTYDNFVKIYYYIDNTVDENKREGKKQHSIGRKLLKKCLKKEFNLEFSDELIEKGKYGKPFLKNRECFFNISHCKGMVVCAISDMEIGIDVEGERKFHESIMDKICDENEKAYIIKQDKASRFLQIWTLKESYVKMIGEGFHFPLKDVTFHFDEKKEIHSNQEGYFYQTGIKGFTISICTIKKSVVPVFYQCILE